MDVCVTVGKKEKLEVMLTVEKYDDKAALYVQFFPRDSSRLLWNQVLQLLDKRLADKGIEVDEWKKDKEGYLFELVGKPADVTVWCDGYSMCGYAYYALKEVQALTKEGLDLSTAIEKVYDRPMQDIDLDEVGEEILERLGRSYEGHQKIMQESLKVSIAGCLKVVVPLKEANAIAEGLSEKLAKYAVRPAIEGDELSNRGTARDALYRLVEEACAVIPEENGRRRYATVSLFDVLQGLYNGSPDRGRQVG
jgi:hypothetical protein